MKNLQLLWASIVRLSKIFHVQFKQVFNEIFVLVSKAIIIYKPTESRRTVKDKTELLMLQNQSSFSLFSHSIYRHFKMW